jgi:hypothetical protein
MREPENTLWSYILPTKRDLNKYKISIKTRISPGELHMASSLPDFNTLYSFVAHLTKQLVKSSKIIFHFLKSLVK